MATSIPREIGATGLKFTRNHIIDDEIAPKLRFPRSIQSFRQMRSDPIISGSLFMIKQYVRKVDWGIEPFGGITATDEDKRIAKIVEDALFIHMDRSFDQLITDICSFIENGFAFHMPTYKVHKGNIIWRDIPTRSVDSIEGFDFDSRGRIKAVRQYMVNNTGEITQFSSSVTRIPYDRLLHFRTDSEKNNPLGRSILKNAYKAWYFKTKLEEAESIGVEREMNGLPVITIPAEYFAADPQEDPDRYAVLQEFIKIGQNARTNEQACVLLPSDVDESGHPLFTFDLVASKGTRSLDTSKIIERYDYRIAQSLLSDFLLMGSTSTGSFALSDNKIGSFVQSLEAYLEVIAEQFNRKAIPKLYRLNKWDDENTCKLVHKPIGSATLSELGEFLEKSAAFITPDQTLENALRSKADLPERDVDNLYIATPTATSQAISQRIGMLRSAETNDSDKEGSGLTEGNRGDDLAGKT
jgi:hypothetical protein